LWSSGGRSIVLLPEEANPVDHLLRSGASRLEAAAETGVFPLEELHALGGDDSFDSGRFQALETRLRLERAPAKGCQLVTEMLHQLLQLRERGYFRTCVV
jgi:hypothetical protein